MSTFESSQCTLNLVPEDCEEEKISKLEKVLDAVSGDLQKAGDWYTSFYSEGIFGLFLRSYKMTNEDSV